MSASPSQSTLFSESPCVNHTATRHPNRKQAAQATENNPTSERKYGKRLTHEVLRLRKLYAGMPGETSHLVYEHFQRRHIRISEEDIDEIIDRHVAALEAELSIVDSTAEWCRAERRRLRMERMEPEAA